MEIKVGQWIMKEGLMVGHFSRPFRVTDVKGQRVYFVKGPRPDDGAAGTPGLTRFVG